MALKTAKFGLTVKNLTEQEVKELMLAVRKIEQKSEPGRVILCWVDGFEKEKNKYEVGHFITRIWPPR